MDSATVHEEIDSLFESTPPLKDSAKIIDKLNQVIQFDSPSGIVPEANRFCTYFPLPDICLYMYTFSYFLGEEKGKRVEELLKRCSNLKKIIIFRVISKAKPHKECQMYFTIDSTFYVSFTFMLYLTLRIGGKMPREVYAVAIVGHFPIAVTNLLDLTNG
ncbi:uncharacterized protein LOC108454259 isoform X2 [Gossypium arboreum]|nr:uncharacterized protein LOC108454259 isoform X2 [Gossypium arboreum]XP_052878137.1 uncharacterized protein LOC108454259 isoform X2 [Gossypium arboreum]XP_052878138.1 uncharacterized protein LOC108454259 isoform X2 [Gossypium arboreum]